MYHQKTRYLTIQGKERNVARRYKPVKVPEIRISGLWLAEQGFFADRLIKVIVRKEVLVIQPVPEDEWI